MCVFFRSVEWWYTKSTCLRLVCRSNKCRCNSRIRSSSTTSLVATVWAHFMYLTQKTELLDWRASKTHHNGFWSTPFGHPAPGKISCYNQEEVVFPKISALHQHGSHRQPVRHRWHPAAVLPGQQQAESLGFNPYKIYGSYGADHWPICPLLVHRPWSLVARACVPGAI